MKFLKENCYKMEKNCYKMELSYSNRYKMEQNCYYIKYTTEICFESVIKWSTLKENCFEMIKS